MEIIPTILTNDPQELKDLLNRVEDKTERIQIDILDGVFIKNKSIDPSALDYIETNVNLDFHLMVKEPVNWVEKCIRAQAQRIIGQIEMMQSQIDFVGKVQEAGAMVGLALDLDTPVSRIDSSVINNLDVVLVMSVPAGFGGQEFNQKAIGKIKELDKLRKNDASPFVICVDGGINAINIKEVYLAGADETAIGRLLFTGEISDNIGLLKKAAA